MGYESDLLKTEFNAENIHEKAVEISVIVENTRERQEALMKVTTHGRK